MQYEIVQLSRELINNLNLEEIDYCLWKNNDVLLNALAGAEDIDMLVEESHYARFIGILNTLNFKNLENPISKIPNIFHFYGMDSQSGKIIHLHVYLKLFTGEHIIKNHHLPVEKMILSNTTEGFLNCRIPCPEVALILFIIRYYIKVSCLPEIFLLHNKKAALDEEFSLIVENVDEEKVFDLLQRHLSAVPAKLFKTLLSEYVDSKINIRKIILGIKLRPKLSLFMRNGWLVAFGKRYYQIIYMILNKYFYKAQKRSMVSGSIIAITGMDASGKSTLVGEIENWLTPFLNVKSLHIGKPEPCLETLVFRGLVKLRRLFKSKHAKNNSVVKKRGLLYAVYYLVIAYERYRALRYGYKLKRRGFIVICDRYPSLIDGKMDSPQITVFCDGSVIIKFMGRLEKLIYQKMPVPDLVFNLFVPLKTALERNRQRDKSDKETDEDLRRTYEINSDFKYNFKYFDQINTSGSVLEVALQLKRKIWKNS